MPDAGHQGHLVRLESHPRTPTETQPATGQPPLDVPLHHHQAGGHPLDDHHQGATMRLTGGQEAQHSGNLLGVAQRPPVVAVRHQPRPGAAVAPLPRRNRRRSSTGVEEAVGHLPAPQHGEDRPHRQ